MCQCYFFSHMNLFCPLASGSKGNAIYLRYKNTRLLIDAGLSARMLEGKLNEIGTTLSEIDAILISHEHVDHIRGLDMIAGKMKIPVLANAETAKAITEVVKNPVSFKIFSTGETFTFGDIEVH